MNDAKLDAISDPLADAIRDELLGLRRKLLRQIRSYPTPIAGCDQQFNHLLARRVAISSALEALESACRLQAGKRRAALESLAETCSELDGTRLRARAQSA